jgi:hypothetical protein
MAKKIIQLGQVNELKTAVIVVTIRNELHEPIQGSMLLTLVCTLYDQDTQSDNDGVINLRDEQSILGITLAGPPGVGANVRVNGGLIDETGVLNLRFDPADNPIIDPTKDVENHMLLLEWTWMDDGVPKYGGQEFVLPVANLNKIAA